MQRWKTGGALALIFTFIVTYYVAFHYPISTGKRVGNLTKLSLKGRIIKTWEGTLNEGFGDKLTTYFSINDEKLAQELYEHEGREVVVYYKEHFYGWPNDTNYDVVKWHPQIIAPPPTAPTNSNTAHDTLKVMAEEWQRGLFCSLLGAIVLDQDLYRKVKERVKEHNPYLAEQIQRCNGPGKN